METTLTMYNYSTETNAVIARIHGDSNEAIETKMNKLGYAHNGDFGGTYTPAFGTEDGLHDSGEATDYEATQDTAEVKGATIIERRDVVRDYGFSGVEAIIDHPKHGRILLEDGFGGIDSIEGGAVRWKHGSATKLRANDTFESLESTPWNDEVNLMQALKAGHDDSRPYLNWSGQVISSVAESLGL